MQIRIHLQALEVCVCVCVLPGLSRSLGRRGRWAGQFESPHSLAVDSRGNLYVGETLDGRRVQRFTPAAGRNRDSR